MKLTSAVSIVVMWIVKAATIWFSGVGGYGFFWKKSLFPGFGEENDLFLNLRKQNCLFDPQLPLYVMLKLKEKNCFSTCRQKNRLFLPKAKKKSLSGKKIHSPPPPHRKSNGCCLTYWQYRNMMMWYDW